MGALLGKSGALRASGPTWSLSPTTVESAGGPGGPKPIDASLLHPSFAGANLECGKLRGRVGKDSRL